MSKMTKREKTCQCTCCHSSPQTTYIITTKALTSPLPSKILISRPITLRLTSLRTKKPANQVRKCPPVISICKTPHIGSIVESVSTSWCCGIWYFFSYKLVHTHSVGANVSAAAIAVGGPAVSAVAVVVVAEALYTYSFHVMMIARKHRERSRSMR